MTNPRECRHPLTLTRGTRCLACSLRTARTAFRFIRDHTKELLTRSRAETALELIGEVDDDENEAAARDHEALGRGSGDEAGPVV